MKEEDLDELLNILKEDSKDLIKEAEPFLDRITTEKEANKTE